MPPKLRNPRRQKRTTKMYKISKRPTFNKSMYSVHHFRRNYTLMEFTYTASGSQVFNAKLSDVPNSTDFTNLFDQYRINKWVVSIYFAGYDNEISNTGAYANIGMVGTAYDFTDTNNPASMNDLKEYYTFKQKQIIDCHPFTRCFRPRLNQMSYNTVSSTAYSVPTGRNPWLTTDTPSAPHFGYKCYFETPPGINMKVRVEARLYFSCRSVK